MMQSLSGNYRPSLFGILGTIIIPVITGFFCGAVGGAVVYFVLNGDILRSELTVLGFSVVGVLQGTVSAVKILSAFGHRSSIKAESDGPYRVGLVSYTVIGWLGTIFFLFCGVASFRAHQYGPVWGVCHFRGAWNWRGFNGRLPIV